MASVQRPPTVAQPGRIVAVPSLTRGSAAPLVIRRLRIKPDKRKGYVEAKANDQDAVETRHASLAERENYRGVLTNNAPLLKRIEEEWRDLAKGTAAPTLDQLYLLGAQLDVLQNKQQRDANDAKTLKDFALTLLRAGQAHADSPETYGPVYPELVASYRHIIGTLDPNANAMALQIGAADQDLAVSAQETAAYREDVKDMGVWGGLAEAEAAAAICKVRTRIFVLDGTGNYQLVLSIGANNVIPNGRDLLFLGNHYEVVQGAVTGQAYQLAHRFAITETAGNCLYDGILLVKHGRHFDTRHVPWATRIQNLRNGVAHNLTDQQIETSILEVLISGTGHGMGSRMSRALIARMVQTDSLDVYLDALGIEPPRDKNHIVRTAWATFVEARHKDPASVETEEALEKMAFQADLLPRVAKPALPQEEGLLSQAPSAKVEEQLRAEALERNKGSIAKSTTNKDQVIITRDQQEYVLDRLGQLVPRMVVRNISPRNEQELKEYKAMWPAGEGELGSVAASGMSGTGSNVIAKPGMEMAHVQGQKPSGFLSATTASSGAVNPKGQAFGETSKSSRVVPVTIDLAYLSPQNIRAVYSHRGIGYWLLHNFTGDKAAVLSVLTKSPGKSGAELGKESKLLSEKEWQALADVIRTTEVLLSGEIPGKAVTKKK